MSDPSDNASVTNYAEYLALTSDDERTAWIAAAVRAALGPTLCAALDALPDPAPAPPPTAAEIAQRRIDELEFAQLVTANALHGHVIPAATGVIVDRAADLFTLPDGILQPRNGQTQPGDPLAPLDFATWLQEQRRTQAFLFES